jgi:hypothetical protein
MPNAKKTANPKASAPGALPRVISLTWEQVQEMFPVPAKAFIDNHAECVRLAKEDGDDNLPSSGDKCTWWLQHDGTEPDEPGYLASHPGYTLAFQDPADGGFSNVSLWWDGEMFG